MLDKAVAAVKADQAVALGMFDKGEGGFLDRDLYPFCFRIADVKTLPTPLAVTSHGCKNAQEHHRQGVWSGTLCRGTKA